MELCVLVILCRYPVFGLSWAYVVSGSYLSIYLIYLYFLSSCLGCPVFFSSVGCFFNGPSKYHLSGLEVEYHGVGKSYWLSSVSRLSVNVSTLLPLHRYNTRTQIQRAHTHTQADTKTESIASCTLDSTLFLCTYQIYLNISLYWQQMGPQPYE